MSRNRNTKSKGVKERSCAGTRVEECGLLYTLRHSKTHQYNSPCESKELVVELFEYRRKYRIRESKVQILSEKLYLKDDELYTEENYSCKLAFLRLKDCADGLLGENNSANIRIVFAYTPGGDGCIIKLGVNHHQRLFLQVNSGGRWRKPGGSQRKRRWYWTRSGVSIDSFKALKLFVQLWKM